MARKTNAAKRAAAKAIETQPPAGEGDRPDLSGSQVSSQASAATGDDIDRLRVPMNRITQTEGGGDPTTSASSLESPIPPRGPDSGFRNHLSGREVEGLGQTSAVQPLQSHILPDEKLPYAHGNDPSGSRPAFVDPETGQQTFQPTTREHIAHTPEPERVE